MTKDAIYHRERRQRPGQRERDREYKRNYRANNPDKVAAHRAVENEVRRNPLFKPLFCGCGNSKPLAHHKDYSKPLEVDWMCIGCHNRHEKSKQPTTGMPG